MEYTLNALKPHNLPVQLNTTSGTILFDDDFTVTKLMILRY